MGVCAEYFRLVFQKHDQEKFSHSLENAIDEVLSPLFDFWIVRDESLSALIGKSFKNRGHKHFDSITIRLDFVERPRIYKWINIIDALKRAQQFDYPTDLLIKIAYGLLYWSQSQTLKKENKLKELIKKAFGAKFYSKRIEISRYYISEINFTELIIYLLNEQTNEK